MSHTVQIKTEFRDLAAIKKAAHRCGATLISEHGKAKLYDGKEHEGTIVRLPKWHFPLIINRKEGTVSFDSFVPPGSATGEWYDRAAIPAGAQSYAYRSTNEIDPLRQAYATEVARAAMIARGYAVTETTTAAGEIKLVAVVS